MKFLMVVSMIVALLNCICGMSILPLPSNIGAQAVTYARTAGAVQEWLEKHWSASSCVLGFDTETRPSFRKGEWHPPAVVQLSTMEACLVAHIHVAPKRKCSEIELAEILKNAAEVREAIAEILSNRSILKAGVGIDDDTIDLWECWGLEVNGRLELGSHRYSLARLLLMATGIELPKPKRISKSDWASALSDQQIAYAAADAWAGRAIYERLAELDRDRFGYTSLIKVLQLNESSCASLHAHRLARQATKELYKSMADDVQNDGMPRLMHTLSNERRYIVQNKTMKQLDNAFKKVRKRLKLPSPNLLPIGPLLEKNAWSGLPGGSAD